MGIWSRLFGKSKETGGCEECGPARSAGPGVRNSGVEQTSDMDWTKGYGYFMTPVVGGGPEEERLAARIYDLIVSWGESGRLPTPSSVVARQFAKGGACTVLLVSESRARVEQAMVGGLQAAVNEIHHVELELADPSKIRAWIHDTRYALRPARSFVVRVAPGELPQAATAALANARRLVEDGKLFDAKHILMETLSDTDARQSVETYQLVGGRFEKDGNLQSAILVYDKAGYAPGVKRVARQLGLAGQSCRNHRTRQAIAKCMRCKAVFCRDCGTECAGMFACRSCMP